MTEPTWTDIVSAIGSVLTPLVVVAAGLVITRRQSRNTELVKVRIDYYRKLVPDLNVLMCYITFIGTWRDISPLEIVQLKRRLDAQFHCASPLFSPQVAFAYKAFMEQSFETFGNWGTDAQILTSTIHRQEAWQRLDETWQSEWDDLFAIASDEKITASSLEKYRRAYDDLLARLVGDLNLNHTRIDYTTTKVSLNASAPPTRAID